LFFLWITDNLKEERDIMKVRIGTRGSKLALAQADIVKGKLESSFPDIQFEIQVIHTQGDIDLKSPLFEIGGKGVFIKELEVALVKNEIEIAVHSMKDITSALLPGLQLTAFLKAEAVTDVFILSPPYRHFEDLPWGATIATGSLRRRALLKKLRPDIKFTDIRGNVLTRISKLKEGVADGLLLSEAGLIRLGLQDQITYRFNPCIFCPAPGQGVIVLETRSNDEVINKLCKAINNEEQSIKTSTELSFLEKVQFDCRAPLGLYAQIDKAKDTIDFTAFLANLAMDQYIEERLKFPIDERIERASDLASKFMEWRAEHDKG
jgi:hydroxymethylbilane synthase